MLFCFQIYECMYALIITINKIQLKENKEIQQQFEAPQSLPFL